MGKLEKLTIKAYTNPKFTQFVGVYKLKINPESYSCRYKTKYSAYNPIDAASSTVKYVGPDPESINFDFYLDATGIIPEIKSVVDEIETFKGLVYSFNGDIHCPNYLILVWGKNLFKCRLNSLNIEHLLFNPNGTPLRTKLKVSFIEFRSKEEIERRANKRSPDLTHTVTVTDGDTLPLMCYRIYGDSKPYLAVARHNNLLDFRYLKPGMQIDFPPLVD